MPTGGGQSSTTTVQKSEPWAEQKPYLLDVFAGAKDLYGKGAPAYYPGQTIAPTANETTQSQNMQAQRALNGSPMMQTAQRQLQDTASGNFLNSNPLTALFQNQAQGGMLNSNPYIDKTYNQAAGRLTDQWRNVVNPALDSRFEAAGRYGSGAHTAADLNSKRALGQELGDLATNIYGGNYANERQMQNQAIQGIGDAYSNERNKQLQSLLVAPQFANQDYFDINQLGQVGAQKEAVAQNQINEDINKYNYGANAPTAALQDYMNFIQGNYGGQSSSSGKSPGGGGGGIAGGLGGLAGGLGLANMLSLSNPWTAGLGIGGGLLGTFF